MCSIAVHRVCTERFETSPNFQEERDYIEHVIYKYSRAG